MSTAYEQTAQREYGELAGQFLFDAFPDNPDDPKASGVSNLSASVETVMRSGHTHKMWIQRYDVRDPGSPNRFVRKVWSPTNSPLFDHGELVGVVHHVEEVSEVRQALSALARALEAGESLPPAEVLHALTALDTSECERQSEQRQALAAEAEQLRTAIQTRDIIGQAKGMLMERYDVDATAAFDLLVKLSQNTNTRVVQVARKLVEIDHPPSSASSTPKSSPRSLD